MGKKFNRVQYQDSLGKTPTDYLCDLLEKGDAKAMRLAAYVSLFTHYGVLSGRAVHVIKSPPIRIWVRSVGRYHLFYSFFKQRNEVCFLYFLEGNKPDKGLDEAIKRVRQFYRL